MGNLTVEQRTIMSILKLMDQYASERERTYSNKDLYMNKFREKTFAKDLADARSGSGVRNHTRLEFKGKASIITRQDMVKGEVLNISPSGVYIFSDTLAFEPNEKVRIKLVPEGFDRPLKSVATVIRIDEEMKGFGYGLRFNTV